VIYNDANDNNLLISDLDPAAARLCGVIDFGDMVHTITVAEPAIAAAYQMLNTDEPMAAAARVISGYDAVRPLTDLERSLLWDLIHARLYASVLMSSEARSREPDNEYLLISAEPVWRLMEELSMIDPDDAASRLNDACGTERVRERGVDEIVSVRRRHFGRNLSMSYQRPLKIVRGKGQYLFDADGRRYLDMVNNVTHVGHCHPRVVTAVQRQMSLLNTNTRYLHDNLIEYIERLAGTMPEPLNVCFLVCTGTEANDLAIRLARAHTGSREIIVVDHAYHGNSPTQIEISPYKCEGTGGQGLAPHAHKVPLPDVFRGLHRGAQAGGDYAAHVTETVAGIASMTGRMGAFMAESMIGCGGQIVPPDGYLEASYTAVREGGGVCIADEVQVGFGRVGSHMWAFELQGVVPDIVTLGKPIGNGHPLAAVVTTPEIAASFDTGMEYFNTFGGNPVSCAAGLAVLDVIEAEGLQRHALEVGERLLKGLRELQARHPLIGDVRGAGLFIGFELIDDRDTLEPAAEAATEVIERMKDRGFLLSTDGPDHNVIKIKPPMVIQPGDVDAALEALDDVMAGIRR
jgi:4-aminobutyrate aminotransferase-like enzyme